MHNRTAEAKAVLEEAAKHKGVAALGAQQTLKNWENGTWALDPEEAQVHPMNINDALEDARRRWAETCASSDVGLWWIADDIRLLMPGATEHEIRLETLRARGAAREDRRGMGRTRAPS